MYRMSNKLLRLNETEINSVYGMFFFFNAVLIIFIIQYDLSLRESYIFVPIFIFVLLVLYGISVGGFVIVILSLIAIPSLFNKTIVEYEISGVYVYEILLVIVSAIFVAHRLLNKVNKIDFYLLTVYGIYVLYKFYHYIIQSNL